MLARVIAVCLALLMLLPAALAAPPASPQQLPSGSSRHAYAELDVERPTLTAMTFEGDFYLYRYVVAGRTYDADEMGQAFRSGNPKGGTSGEAFAADLERAVDDALTAMLRASFTGSEVGDVVATADRSTLQAPGGSRFDPPVRVAVTGRVDQTREGAGLGSLSDDAVAAAFRAGAKLVVDDPLTAEPGHRIVYSLAAPASPAGLTYEAGPGVSADGSTLVVDVDNTGGQQPTRVPDARLRDAAVRAPAAEDIRSVLEVALQRGEGDASALPANIRLEAELRALDTARRFPGALPEKVELPFVNADGVRALLKTGAIGQADVARADAALLEELREALAGAFGAEPTLAGGLDPVGLAAAAGSPYAAEPPLRYVAEGAAAYAMQGARAEDVDLALRIGATAELNLHLTASTGPTTYVFRPPSNGEFTQADGGTLTASGQVASFEVAPDAPRTAALELRGKGVPRFDAADAEMAIKVDLQRLDVTLGGALSRDFGDLFVELTVTGTLQVMELPESFRRTLPERLQLDHLSSDAFRLLVESGKISEADLAELEAKLLGDVDRNLGAALGGDVRAEGGFLRDTLAASLVSTPISAETPIVFEAKARVKKPVAGGPVEQQAAIALHSQSLPLRLPKVQALDTVYTVILPRGLAVTDLTGAGGDYETGKAPDGRDQFTVRPTSEAAEVTATMAVTPTFVLLKFWPFVLLAVLVLVLLVGTPIALVRLRKRGAKGKAK